MENNLTHAQKIETLLGLLKAHLRAEMNLFSDPGGKELLLDELTSKSDEPWD